MLAPWLHTEERFWSLFRKNLHASLLASSIVTSRILSRKKKPSGLVWFVLYLEICDESESQWLQKHLFKKKGNRSINNINMQASFQKRKSWYKLFFDRCIIKNLVKRDCEINHNEYWVCLIFPGCFPSCYSCKSFWQQQSIQILLLKSSANSSQGRLFSKRTVVEFNSLIP